MPPIEIQRKIVEEIEGYQKIIDGARQVIENWKPDMEFEIEEERKKAGMDSWMYTRLGEICEINSESGDPKLLFGNDSFIYIDISSVENGGTGRISFDQEISVDDAPSRARRIIRVNDILISTTRPNLKGFTIIKSLPKRVLASTGFAVVRCKSDSVPDFIFPLLLSETLVKQMIAKMGKGSYPSINQEDMKSLYVPLVPSDNQKNIAKKLSFERDIIEKNAELIAIYREKIRKVISHVWDD